MPEYMQVPTPAILGAPVQHCNGCGKRLAPHDAVPVREEGGQWSCIVCPTSIAPKTFAAPMLDADKLGHVRDVSIEVYARSLLVRVGPSRAGGEDVPHHRAADFTAQRAAIVAAFSEVVTEIANAAKVGTDIGFDAGVKAERARVTMLLAHHFSRPAIESIDEVNVQALRRDIKSGRVLAACPSGKAAS